MPSDRPSPWPRNTRSIEELEARAGTPDPSVRPVIIARVPSARPGWDDVTVSLRPGHHVNVTVRTSLSNEGAIANVLRMAQAIYSPGGLRVDPYAEENP